MIVASVIGIVAIDIYQQTEVDTPPTADFDTEQYGDEDQQVRLFHNTGDALDPEDISVIVDSDELDRTEVDGSEFPNDDISSQDSVYFALDENDGSLVVDTEADLGGDVEALDAGTEISVIWNSADMSATLFEYEVEER